MSGLESALRRDRWITAGGLVVLAAASWAYLIHLARAMESGMPTAMAPAMRAWTGTEFAAMFVMWSVMMVGMMVPSAAPMILLHARVHRHNGLPRTGTATVLFTAGYLAVWTAFSLAATAAQWGLESAALLSPMMVSTSRWLGVAVLLAAGVYQLTPLKDSCLTHCRSPLHFITTHWQQSPGGAFAMGLKHGAYCVGCCWTLMALLFVLGVMNLLWIAVLSAFVLAEKVMPTRVPVARLGGIAMLAAAVWIAVG